MSAIPTPPKTEPKVRRLNERLIHKPLQNHQGLNDLLDRLEFAPRGQEHKPR